MTGTSVYLDHNATTCVRPEVAEAVARALECVGNPSSVHGPGRRARRMIEDARAEVAGLVGVEPRQIVFTSGGTEANNMAVLESGARRLFISAIEHPSVQAAAEHSGREVRILPVTRDGRIDIDRCATEFESLSEGDLVSVMLANNETGVIQPVAEIAALARARGARVHCDAVQAAGKIAIDFAALGVDYLSLSAHKIAGPMGVGALVMREGTQVAARIIGGGQESGRRSGTENLPGIVGFGVAARLAGDNLERFAALADLRDRLEARLRHAVPEVQVFGAEAPRLANTSCLAMPGVAAETQVIAFDLDGFAVSAGSACSSGKVRASSVLVAMGVAPELAGQAIRISLGWTTQAQDVEAFASCWLALYERLVGTAPADPDSGKQRALGR